MITNLYDVFVKYIMPNFIDLSAYPHAQEAFFWAFAVVCSFIAIYVFIWLPFSVLRWIGKGGKRTKSRFLK